MKKIFLLFIAICSLFTITSCDINFEIGGSKTEVEKYTITFYTYGIVETPAPIKDVTKIPNTLPNIDVDIYDFLGWYYDDAWLNKAFPGDELTSDVMLYAKLIYPSGDPEVMGPVITPTPNVPTQGESIPTPDVPTQGESTPTPDIPTQGGSTPTLDVPTQGESTPTPNVPTQGESTPTPNVPTFDDTNKLVSSKTCDHTFVNYECSKCSTEYDVQVYNIFKSNTIIYDNDTTNPYDVNLDLYGSDVKVIFYETKLDYDMYTSVSKTEFYSNYTYAASYEEAYYRSQHKYMSGDITDQNHLTPTGKVMSGTLPLRCTTAIYILDYNGGYLGYIPNSLTGDNHVIWYGGAYISFNDVAAYLLAFGEVPTNSYYDKGTSGKKLAVSDWGKYGRVNYGSYSNNTSKYPYEPKLFDTNGQKYTETDFGTCDTYYTGDRKQTIYNNGSSITRGAARFCFVNNKKNIDLRYVYYTYNHYNDYQEYLNYENGFGPLFGYETAGNAYGTTNGTPTQYNTVAAVLKTYQDLINLK